MFRFYVGVDNGVSGTIAILDFYGHVVMHCSTPVKKELSYTKSKNWINRIDVIQLIKIFYDVQREGWDKAIAIIERPFVNPGMFKSTLSAMRALEATIIVFEQLGIPYRYIDSKEWQKKYLPSGVEKNELKKAAVDIARRMFPSVETKDADGLLIAAYAYDTMKVEVVK
jgi:hypothetical protein